MKIKHSHFLVMVFLLLWRETTAIYVCSLGPKLEESLKIFVELDKINLVSNKILEFLWVPIIGLNFELW